MSQSLELEPFVFERELHEERPLTVLDTRDPAAFASWHVTPRFGVTVNLGEAELAGDPGQVRALTGDGSALRVVCQAGIASLRVAELLAGRGIEALSVRGGMIAWSRLLRRGAIPLAAPFSVVQFRREARGCLSYLVSAGDEAIVVDPAPSVDAYLEEAQRRGVRIVRVLDTHVHADHVSGGRELAERTGATLNLSAAALERGIRYADRVEPVTDGDTLALADATVTVVALPGHTSDMVGLQLGNLALLAGDSLFVDSVARPDLERGDEGAAESARRLYRTLHGRIGSLGDGTLLLPSHYPGGHCERPIAAALGTVWREVPELWLGEDAFVSRVLAEVPPKPANFGSIIEVNLGADVEADTAARLEIGANNCAARGSWALASAAS